MTKNTLHLRESDIAAAAAILRGGGLVAFATETVYGLGANALDAEAVAGIFRAKGRPAWDPLIVHLPDFGRVAQIAEVTGATARRVQALAEAFWPGPLTMLLPRTVAVPDAVTAGRPLVGVRVPAHSSAQALLRLADVPIAAPSANQFAHVSPTTAEHVLRDLGSRIDAVLDAGPCTVGVESTVLDPAPTPMVIYRAGAVTQDALREVAGVPVTLFEPPQTTRKPEALPSPGVGLRHYAPSAAVSLTPANVVALWAEVERVLCNKRQVGVLLPGGWAEHEVQRVAVRRWGEWRDQASLAADLFAGLRDLELQNVDVIVCPLPEAGGMGDALRDRLLKAAKPR